MSGSKTRSSSDRRILDEGTRMRRHKRQLEALEKDNHHDDPHASFAHLLNKVKLPSFSDGTEKKRRKTRSNADHFKQRFRKTFQSLLEELATNNNNNVKGPSYLTAAAPPSKFPPRHFCAVCGFPSSYKCVSCGTRYCCTRCLGTHQDTRCLKWTV
ncbi:PREDICTED: zinc finger HIT domain-containing protein 1-like [Amphimedon queenslandica]|uniref:HIT-type domain-containing protein n=1 Tax=Amphimedon queenslandica TaxID=400682 RepID=A0A1X7VMM9_AMPQE|nr:PREDICTED: zinc finger HIT domain-containing protein 1-like [Amphimedon queenslandica]|eukprot:XP_019864248.1 PREDICTED: zinc finger HIT domain-containing protein 1-like [Amphimedon queenslandica]